MNKALAFRFDDDLLCLKCTVNLSKKSEYADLLFTFMTERDVIEIDKMAICPESGENYASYVSEKDIDNILKLRIKITKKKGG